MPGSQGGWEGKKEREREVGVGRERERERGNELIRPHLENPTESWSNKIFLLLQHNKSSRFPVAATLSTLSTLSLFLSLSFMIALSLSLSLSLSLPPLPPHSQYIKNTTLSLLTSLLSVQLVLPPCPSQ